MQTTFLIISVTISVSRLDDAEIKYEVLSSDDEFDFQFELDDQDYDEILRGLKAEDSDAEELDNEVKIDCPFKEQGCKRSFARNHNLLKHLKSHELGLDKPGSICHICGKTIKGVYSLHLKIHENTKQYNCDDCGRSFRQKVALNNHCESRDAMSPNSMC